MKRQLIIIAMVIFVNFNTISQTPSVSIADIDINIQQEYDNWVLNSDTFFVIPVTMDTFITGVDSFCFNVVYDPSIMKPVLNISGVNDPAYLLIQNYLNTVPFTMIEDQSITVNTFSVPDGREMLTVTYSNTYAFNQSHYGNCQGYLMYIPFKKQYPCFSGSFAIDFWDGLYNGTYINSQQTNSFIFGGIQTYSVASGTLTANNGSLNASALDVIISQYGNNLESNVVNGVLPYSFEWSSGETSPFITPTQVGDYYLIVTDANTCVDTSNVFTFYFVDIESHQNTEAVKIYPIPSNNHITIETGINNDMHIEIFDISRRSVYTSIINEKKQININSWDSGIYYVRLDNMPFGKFIVY